MEQQLQHWKVWYQEQSSDVIHKTSLIGPYDAKQVIDWFGLDQPDVTWYELENITEK